MFDHEPFAPCMTQEQQQAYLDAITDPHYTALYSATSLAVASLCIALVTYFG